MKISIKEFLDINTVKSKFLVLSMMASSLLTIFDIAYKKPQLTDPLPQITPITTTIIKDLGDFAVKVRTGLFIKDLPQFEPIKNLFIFDAIIWFEFNSDEIMRETVENFSFDKGTIINKTTADIRIMGKKIFAKYNIKFSINCDLNYHKFPFEDHRITIVLANNLITPEEMYYVVDGSSFQVAPNIFPASWKLQDLNVDAGYQQIQLDKQDQTRKTKIPKALFIINVIKSSLRKILIIFLPLFSAIFFSFFSLTMNIADNVGRFSLAISAVTALLGYRFVIEQMMPPVGYFNTTDSIYLFLLITSFLVFIYQLFMTSKYNSIKENGLHPPSVNALIKFNNYTFLLLVVFFICITGFILLT